MRKKTLGGSQNGKKMYIHVFLHILAVFSHFGQVIHEKSTQTKVILKILIKT